MDFNKHFSTNLEAEKNGVWVNIGEGAEVLVARHQNSRHVEVIRRLTEPVKKLVRNNMLPEDQLEEIMLKAMAEAILLDWKGFTEEVPNPKYDEAVETSDANPKTVKQPVPYSREKALEFLKNKDFRAIVHEIATERESFRRQNVEDSTKN